MISPDVALPMVMNTIQSQSLVAFGIVLLSIGALFFLWKKNISANVALFLLLFVQFFDVYIFGFEQNNGRTNPQAYFSERKQLIQILKDESKEELFRINARVRGTLLMDRNQGMIDRIFLMEGYTPLAMQRVLPIAPTSDISYEMLNTKYRLKIDTMRIRGQLQRRMGLAVDPLYLPRAFFVYNAKVFSTAQEESLYLSNPAFNPREVVTLEESPGTTFEDRKSVV